MEKEMNKLHEELQNASCLLMLLENDLSQQRSDEVYLRTVRIVHNIVSSALSEIDQEQ